MKRTLISIAAVAAAGFALSAGAASTSATSWPTASQPGQNLPEPVYVRLHHHINKSAYVGLATRAVPMKADGQVSPLGADYAFVLDYVSGGQVHHVALNDVRYFNIIPSTGAGEITLRDGKTLAVDVGRKVRLPSSACRVTGGHLNMNDCKPAVLAGTLVDLEGEKVLKDHALHLTESFDYMEVATGADATAKFGQARDFIEDIEGRSTHAGVERVAKR